MATLATATTTADASSASIAVQIPTFTAGADQCAVMVVARYPGGDAVGHVPATPSGWTLVGGSVNTSFGASTYVFMRLAPPQGLSGTTVTVTYPATQIRTVAAVKILSNVAGLARFFAGPSWTGSWGNNVQVDAIDAAAGEQTITAVSLPGVSGFAGITWGTPTVQQDDVTTRATGGTSNRNYTVFMSNRTTPIGSTSAPLMQIPVTVADPNAPANYSYVRAVFTPAVAPGATLLDPVPAGQTAGYEHVYGSVTLSATVDNPGAVARVDFHADAALIASDTAAAGSTYSVLWNTVPLVNGPYSLTATTVASGGAEATSQPRVVVVNNDGEWAGPGKPTTTYIAAGEGGEGGAVRLAPDNVTQGAMDSSVQSMWTAWKAAHLVENATNGWWAVRADAQGGLNPYVAEGQGYGMMLAAQMAPFDSGARVIFDGILKYVLDHPSSIDADLHAAEQDINMVSHNGGDSATDGDMDIAFACLQAHQRWGSTSTMNYQGLARTRIAAIKRSLISASTGLLKLGDWSTTPEWNNISRTSDWMIGHFEAFYRTTGDLTWTVAASTHMNAVNRLQQVYAPTTGLLPDFTAGASSSVAPAPSGTLEGEHDAHYYYNACRTPWRLAAAADAGARTAADRMAAWAKVKCGGTPGNLPTGYLLDGTTVAGGTYQDTAFIAPFAVAATVGSDQAWLNALWAYLAANTSVEFYYSASIQLLSMIHVGGTYRLTP